MNARTATFPTVVLRVAGEAVSTPDGDGCEWGEPLNAVHAVRGSKGEKACRRPPRAGRPEIRPPRRSPRKSGCARALTGHDGTPCFARNAAPQRAAIAATVFRDVAQLGRAPALGAGSRQFESGRPDFLDFESLRLEALSGENGAGNRPGCFGFG